MNSERFGALFSEWHPDKNGDLELEMFSRGSDKRCGGSVKETMRGRQVLRIG